MSQVKIIEVVEALLLNTYVADEYGFATSAELVRSQLAKRIQAHGIAPPDGWVLVPIEPTEQMKMAGNDAFPDERVEMTISELCRMFYKAMLTAAPKQEVKP